MALRPLHEYDLQLPGLNKTLCADEIMLHQISEVGQEHERAKRLKRYIALKAHGEHVVVDVSLAANLVHCVASLGRDIDCRRGGPKRKSPEKQESARSE